jgi:hypothetical protein
MLWNWIDSAGLVWKQSRPDRDLEVCLLEPRFHGFKAIIKRVDNGRLKTDDDMYLEAFALISSKWIMIGQAELQPHTGDPLYLESIIRIDIGVPSNQRSGFSLFPCIRIPGERQLPVPPHEVVSAYRTWDVYYWRHFYSVTFYVHEWASIWKEVRLSGQTIYGGLPWEENRFLGGTDGHANAVPSLKVLCLRMRSWTNLAFAGDKDGPYTVHSMSNLYPIKLPRMLERFDKPTRYTTQNMRSITHLWPGALDMLYHAMGTRSAFGTQVWDYEEAKEAAVLGITKLTASGLRSGPRLTAELPGGLKVVGSATGKKVDQLPYAVKELDKTRDLLFKDKTYTPPDAAAQISLKDEAWNKMGMAYQEAKDLAMKLRPFYIIGVFQYLMAAMCLKFRQIVERGRVIKIGINFWFGGATAFAMSVAFDDPNIIFEDGDFKHLDSTLHMILLMLYVTQASVYFNWKAMTETNRLLLKAFFRICGERLSIKVTHFFSTIWRVVYGGMPSGAYETSHGDSWIVAFLYFLYVKQVMERYPERVTQIRELYRLFRCGIVVYGDDHVLFTHRDVHDIINESGFARFVSEFWGMKIRDIHRAKFLTVPNRFSGEIDEPGIVFLKRYFVDRSSVFTAKEIKVHSISPVVPYRPLGALIMKLAYGKADEKSLVEYIVSSIGMAYDTQGTNKVAYEFCKHIYLDLSRHVDGRIQDVLKEFMAKMAAEGKDAYVTRLMRTAAISENDIVRGFPTWEELISRHKYSRDAVKFGGYKEAIDKLFF